MIRVILADDHTMIRHGLRAVLSAAPDIEVVGDAANGIEAVDLTERLQPDVVVMDVGMDRMDGLEATRQIVAKKLPSQVLVLSQHVEEQYLVRMMQAGARGYLVKSQADYELVDAIRAVARGEMSVRQSAAPILARGLARGDGLLDEQEGYESLSERERVVLRLFATGLNAPEIGRKLGISPKTVDTYKQRINEKLHITHRTEYIQMALRLGLISS